LRASIDYVPWNDDRSARTRDLGGDRFAAPMPLRVRDTRASEEELGFLAAIRAGDEQAFTTVVERHYPAMLALAKAYVRAPGTATTIVHDAWEAALAASDGFDGRTGL
jgi:hypothetical protein